MTNTKAPQNGMGNASSPATGLEISNPWTGATWKGPRAKYWNEEDLQIFFHLSIGKLRILKAKLRTALEDSDLLHDDASFQGKTNRTERDECLKRFVVDNPLINGAQWRFRLPKDWEKLRMEALRSMTSKIGIDQKQARCRKLAIDEKRKKG